MEQREIKEKVSDGHIYFSAILEMVGKPKEHVNGTIRDYVARLKNSENIIIAKEEYHDPKQLEESEMFSAFVELELLAKSTEHVVWFCFDYMPSSIEIFEPESLSYKTQEFTNFLNDLQARLHHIDMNFKKVNVTNQALNRNTENLLKNSIRVAISAGHTKVNDISKVLGIAEENLAKILDNLVENAVLRKSGDEYAITKK
ncbi:MAG: hypothetical protein ACOC32_00145 [Nanoarchaeota archaeon]